MTWMVGGLERNLEALEAIVKRERKGRKEEEGKDVVGGQVARKGREGGQGG